MNTTRCIQGSLLALITALGACASDGTSNEPTGSAESNLGANAGLSFSSTGDPHEVTGDGYPFENQNQGTFTAIKSYSAIVKDGSPGELMVLKKQQSCGTGVFCNTGVAAYVAGARLKLPANGNLVVNGTSTTMDTGTTMTLPKPDGSSSGATLARSDPAAGQVVYTLTSPVGDSITITLWNGATVDLTGTISMNRAGGRVRGSLGCFDADRDQSDDLCKRFTQSLSEIEVNGQETFYPLTSDGVTAFLKDWRTVQADCLMANVAVDASGHCSW
jgi:hypothetical protein